MKFRIYPDVNILKLTEATPKEIFTLNAQMNRRIDGYHFKKKYLKGWDGIVSFFKNNKFIPLGLRSELETIADRFNYTITYENPECIEDQVIDAKKFRKQMLEFFEGHAITPYDYQIDAALEILRKRRCLAELATSAGKTLITFMTFVYQLTQNKDAKILMIVPNVSLVEQVMNDMYDYNQNKGVPINIQPIYSGTKMIENANIVIGTYQSLVKKEKEYFEPFSCVIVDEVHKTTAQSIRTILQRCLHCEYRYGVSGTIQKKGSIDRWNVMAYLGPIVSKVSASSLMKSGHITKLKISIYKLNHSNEKFKRNLYKAHTSPESDPVRILKLERDYLMQHPKRLKVVGQIAKKFTTGNSLILFTHVEFGCRIYEHLKEVIKGRKIYYIDGSVDVKQREYYKEQIKNVSDGIIVASYGTFATGISVKSFKYGLMAEPIKDEKLLRQTIGRLLRKHNSKTIAHMIDLQDDLSVQGENGRKHINYTLRHGRSRMKTYREQKFKYKLKEIQL